MSNSWLNNSASVEYRDALEGTNSLYSDSKAVGFVKGDEISTKAATLAVKQNNLIINLLTTIARKQTETEENIKLISSKIFLIEKQLSTINRPEVKIPDESLTELTEKLKGLKVGSSRKGKEKEGEKTPFYVRTDPYDIYKEVRKQTRP